MNEKLNELEAASPEEKLRSVRGVILEAYGQAAAFNLLGKDESDLTGEVKAAKETGKLIQENLKKVIEILGPK